MAPKPRIDRKEQVMSQYLEKAKQRFEAKFLPVPEAGCWLWESALDSGGYGLFAFNGKAVTAHRVSWTLYRGAIPNGVCVLHKCDERSCVNPDHFFLGSQSDNALDMVKKKRGNHSRGEKNGWSTLTADQVRSILSDDRAQSVIAKAYGTTQANVSSIKLGKAWKHIPR
jgi:hypothetical protein